MALSFNDAKGKLLATRQRVQNFTSGKSANLVPGASPEAKVWTLEGKDEGFKTRFQGQYIAQGMEESVGSVFGETISVGKQRSDFQWLHGEDEPFNFTARIFANSSFNNIKQEIELLKSFSRRDKVLKRSPRALFTTGTEIGFMCFVKGVKIQYDELRDDGSIRGCIVSISLQKIEDTITENAATSLRSQIKFSAGQISAGAALFANSARGLIHIPGGSLHTVGRRFLVKQGDTFESIAAMEYGNALLGDVLRRAQPQKEPITPSDEIILVERSDILTITVTPQSVALKNTFENLALRREKLAVHNKSTVILV